MTEENRKPRRKRRRRRKPSRQSEPAPPQAEAQPSEPWDPTIFEVPKQEGLTRFHDLDLPDELMHAIYDLGFNYCTPVQAETLPVALKGRDIAAKAQTGTGKTAAFLIRIFQHMLLNPRERGGSPSVQPRALVLAPTRELAMQIEKDAQALGRYCPASSMVMYGGTDVQKERAKLARNQPELIVATPGRLLDFQRRRVVDLSRVEILVIDEADRMLDMGFIPDVRSIVYSTPRKDRRQTMLYSATLSDDVTRLAASWTRDPVRVEIDPEQVAVDTVNQIVYIVTSRQKFSLLYNILRHEHLQRVLLFANRRDAVARLADRLRDCGIHCALISGAIPQDKRTRTLKAFREGDVRVLVATDVASRGLHIEDIGHVINYNVPLDPEDYVHRIGRTGRAGAKGTSITFACEEEAMYIPDVEEFIGNALSCTYPPEEWLTLPPDAEELLRKSAGRRPSERKAQSGGGGGRNHSRGSRRRRRRS